MRYLHFPIASAASRERLQKSRIHNVRYLFSGLFGFLLSLLIMARSADAAESSSTSVVDPTALIGDWAGSVELGQTSLPVQVSIESVDPISGRFYFVGQSKKGAAIIDASLNKNDLSFSVNVQPALRFTGSIENQSFKGIALIAQANGKFSLTKVAK